MHHSPSSLLWTALHIPILIALASCGSTPPPAETHSKSSSNATSAVASSAKIEQEVNSKFQVVAIEASARLVTLRGEDGRLIQLHAGDAVRNLDQISVGDTLQVRYQTALTATQLPDSASMRTDRGAAVAARAAKGATPAAGIGMNVSIRVQIESIDLDRDIVVFSKSDGELISHRVTTDAGRAFVRKLAIGDLVQLDYEQLFALAIDKISP